jgi:hypothetical protein
MIVLRRHAVLVFAVLASACPQAASAQNERNACATSCEADAGKTSEGPRPNCEDARSLVFDDTNLFEARPFRSIDRLPESFVVAPGGVQAPATPREATPQRTPPRC